MRKITILLICFLGIYLIYSFIYSNKVNYVSISDSVMSNYNVYIYNSLTNKKKLSSFNDNYVCLSIIDAYKNIRNNQTIRVNNEDYYLKKVLRESDILVISVGMEELSNNFDKYDMQANYSYFAIMYNDIQRLVNEIKKYAYGKILFLGYYNPTNYYDSTIDRFFYDMNIKLNRLMMDNNIIYIDLYELIKGNNYKEKNEVYLNNNGNQKIVSIINYYID